MEPNRHSKPPGSPIKRILFVVLACALLAGCGYEAGRWYRDQDPPAVRIKAVSGTKTVSVDGPTPVGTLLKRAGVTPTAGHLTAVVSHKVIDPNYAPPVILVNDRGATLTTPVSAGAKIEVSNGVDTVEHTVSGEVPDGGTPPATDVLTKVVTPGKPGRALVTQGERSGEVVTQTGVVGAEPPAPRTDKVVALTFDDGPGPVDDSTLRILDILKDKGVKAVFCPIGVHIAGHPDWLRRELAEGHLLCGHTLNHDEHLDKKSKEVVDQQMDGGNKAIVDATGVYPSFYRPPAGSLSPTVIAEANARGQQVLKWSVESNDYTKPGVDTIVRRTTTDIPNGAIILFHDGGGDRSQTVAALPKVIDSLRAQGFTFVLPQSTLIAPAPAPVPQAAPPAPAAAAAAAPAPSPAP